MAMVPEPVFANIVLVDEINRTSPKTYAGGSSAPPGPGERRALRGALVARGGLRRRLRGLIAIPPGGPPPRRR